MRNKINQKKFAIALLIYALAGLSSIKVFANDLLINKGETLTLERCINIAISKNPNINLGNNLTKINQSKIGQAKSFYMPQVNLSTGYSRENPITNSVIDKTTNQYSGSIGVNQLIYDFGKTPTKIKIEKLNLNASRSDVQNTIVDVSYNVKQAYYQALSAKLNSDIADKSIKQYENHLKQSKAFFQAGVKPKIDVINAEVNLGNAKLNYIKANNGYQLAIASLNQAMGFYDAPEYNIADAVNYNNNAVDELSISNKDNKKNNGNTVNKPVITSKIVKNDIIEKLNFDKYDISLDLAIKKAFDNRPDLKSLLLKEKASDTSVKLAKKDYYPTLSGFANYGAGGNKFPVDNGWALGANINVPVFNGFLTKNKINEAKANLDVAKSEVEILKQNIYYEVQQAYINLTQAEKRIPVSNLIVKQAKENLELANGRYTAGVGDFVELQDAEVNFNNAQLSYVQSLYDYNTARSNLEKAMGVK